MDYRLAPENKAPAALYDGYAAVKWVVANAETLKIDTNHLCIMGESGGAWVVGGTSILLAERDESHLVKFQALLIPQVGNMYVLDNADDSFKQHELPHRMGLRQLMMLTVDDFEACKTDPYIFPNLITDEFCKKMPNTIVWT